MKNLKRIPGVSCREPAKGFLEITAEDGYRFSATLLGSGKWKFTDGEPTRPCHFTLRHIVHQALNPDPWKALGDSLAGAA